MYSEVSSLRKGNFVHEDCSLQDHKNNTVQTLPGQISFERMAKKGGVVGKKTQPPQNSNKQAFCSNGKKVFIAKKKIAKAWCWYCDRCFDDEPTLIQHQRAKHFRCAQCMRQLNSAAGLVIHIAQVHKQIIEKVPGAIPGHDTPELEIFGMEGIPEGDLERHEKGLPPQPYKRPKFLESGGLLPLLAAQKASSGAISVSGGPLFDAEQAAMLANSTPWMANTAINTSIENVRQQPATYLNLRKF